MNVIIILLLAGFLRSVDGQVAGYGVYNYYQTVEAKICTYLLQVNAVASDIQVKLLVLLAIHAPPIILITGSALLYLYHLASRVPMVRLGLPL